MRLRHALRIFLVTLLGAANAVSLQTDQQQFEGKNIATITFEPRQQPLAASELNEILPLRMRTPYHAADVRKSIERLYATGRYQDIVVDAEVYNDGVAVKFITKNSWFIGKIEIQGTVTEPPNNGQMVNATRLQLGEPFDPAALPAAEDGIKKSLTSNGYYEGTVQTKLEYDAAIQQVNITFQVHSGKRARFTSPELRGTDVVLTPKQIIRASKWRRFLIPGWHPVTQTRVRRGVESIRLKYENSGRLLATVTLDSMNYDEKSNTAAPHLSIRAGPDVEIKTVGTKVRKKKLKANVPVFEEHTVDRDLLEEGRRNLRDEFQSSGYFEADVEFKQQVLRDNKEEIDYIINLGKRHRFVSLQITGNKYFTTDTIRERMYLIPKSFEFRHGRYSDVFVKRDEETVTNLYKSNGFRDVKITSKSVDDYKGKVGDLAVFFNIEEGPQWFVSKLDIVGPQLLDISAAMSKLSSAVGQPYSESNVAEDRDTISTLYFENGFRDSTFEWSSKPGASPNQMELTYVIHEGRQQFVREVLSSGLHTTNPRLVNRNIRLNPADPLSPIRMAETQKRLYDLGVFAQVDMAVQNPDGDETHKYVLYEMEEAKRYSVTGGFGAEFAKLGGGNAQADLANPGGSTGVNPRVSLDVSRINFLGRGQTLSFRSRFSSFQKRGLIDYLAPRIFNHDNLDLSFTTLYDDSHDVRTFSAQREEFSVQLTDRISKPLTAFFRFSYRNVHVGTLKIDPLLLPRLSQSVRVGEFSVNLVQDRRDDPTDSHKGIYNTIDVGLASNIFGSQTNFLRLLARNATYHRIGKKLVLAREIEFGIQPAFKIPANADPSDPIPLPERFFAGGGNSHRGFPENQAGPRDLKTGFPLGGSALLFNKTELRFPLFGANINGVIFHDMGNVYARMSDISFRWSQRDLTDFNYMVHAVGFGIRYRTPIGPVRLDLADSINSPRFNGFKGTYNELVQCSLAGTCVSSAQRISHFQFFFSIGQTF